MKKLLAIFALCAAVLSCEKDKDGNNNDDNNGGGGNNSAVTEVDEITFPDGDEFQINELDKDGKVMRVGLKPEGAPASLLKFTVEDPSVATVEPASAGILCKPVKVGSTKVTVGAKAGSATSKSFTLTVKQSSLYSDKVIDNISVAQSSVEIDDYEGKTADIAVTLSNGSATLNDVYVSSSADHIVKAVKQSGNNLRLEAVTGGEATVTLTALNGKGKASISVKVYGHINDVWIVVPDSESESGGYRGIMVGHNQTLICNVDKTGDLRVPASAKWSTSGDMFTIDATSGKINSTKAGGSSKSQTVTVTYGTKTATQAIRVYDFGNGIKLLSTDGSSTELTSDLGYIKPSSYRQMKVVILPEATARQSYDVTISDESALTANKYSNNILNLTGVKAVYEDVSVKFSPAHVNGQVEKTCYIHVGHYVAEDLKPGDYVYYNSSTKKFNHSDGGLRYYDTASGKSRKMWMSAVSGKGTHIGYVFKLGLPGLDDAQLYSMDAGNKLSGISDASNKHCYVIAKDGAGNVKWSAQEFSVGLNESSKYTDYTNKLTLDSWNSANAGKTVLAHQTAVNYASKVPVQIGTSSSNPGSTGWMLPCRKTAEELLKLPFLVDIPDLKGAGGWTSTESNATRAYFFTVGYDVVTARKIADEGGEVRPILIL